MTNNNIGRTLPSPPQVYTGANTSSSGLQPAGSPDPNSGVASQRSGLSYARSASSSLPPSIRQARESVSTLTVPVKVIHALLEEKCTLDLRFQEAVPRALSRRIAAMLGTVTLERSDGDNLVFIESEQCFHAGFQLRKSMQVEGSTFNLSMQVDADDNITQCKLTEITQAGRETLLNHGSSEAEQEDVAEAASEGEGEATAAAGGTAKHDLAADDCSDNEDQALPKRQRVEHETVQAQGSGQKANPEAEMQRSAASRLAVPARGTARRIATSRALRTLTHAVSAPRIPARVTTYIRNNFHRILNEMLTRDLFTEHPTERQKQDNSYHAQWVLPMEKRFFAVLLQTAYDACKAEQFEVTAVNVDSVLNQAVATLQNLHLQKTSEINATLATAHDMTNDNNAALTLKNALQNLPRKFAKMSEINVLLEHAASRISEADPTRPVDPQQLAKQCVPGCIVDYLQNTLAFDADNPFLPYLEDTDRKSALLHQAQAWNYIIQNVGQELSPALLTNLWGIFSGKGVPDAGTNHPLPGKNGNRTVLMEAGPDTRLGTFTPDGMADLMARLEQVAERSDVTITVGHEEDVNDSREYGRTVVTLERKNVSVEVLSGLLKSIVNDCKQKIAEAEGDEEKLTAAQIRLAMALTQCRLLPDENLTVGLFAVNLLRLQSRQSVPFTLPNPDILDGHSLPEIKTVVRAGGA